MSLGTKKQFTTALGDYKASIYEKLKKSSNNNSFIKRNQSQEKTYTLKESVDKSLERRRIITNNFEANNKDLSFTAPNKNFLEYMKNNPQVVKLNPSALNESKLMIIRLENNISLSKMYVDNLQCRGNLIKSLKTNINEEKLYRKKILNNDNSMLQKRSESLGDHDPDVVAHKKNNSFAYNTNLYKQYRNNISNKTKNGKPEDLRVDSLWEVQNTELSVGGQKYNNNTIANDLSFDGGKECQTCANLKRYHIENSVDDSIRKLHDNPIKLYSLLKKYFDDVVRQCPDFKILEKLHNGYIDSMQGILAEYKILKEKNESYEAMMNSK
jgi:hypothetical protein